jgi:hypothetical protein
MYHGAFTVAWKIPVDNSSKITIYSEIVSVLLISTPSLSSTALQVFHSEAVSWNLLVFGQPHSQDNK